MTSSPPSLIDLFCLQANGERIMFMPAVWPVVMDCDDAEEHALRVLNMVREIRAQRHA
ncbi:hypothetical protein ABZ297_20880 [Nonomuraea sp. NPDC005983]|uniref:hypothetical protein n=1 Tax=Nonomuraea sp. NPDC005983 TaxID=3155595 RepID=UPI0033A973AB